MILDSPHHLRVFGRLRYFLILGAVFILIKQFLILLPGLALLSKTSSNLELH